MAIAFNSNINRSGLVTCFDAANLKSYPGSGSIWYDVSGNGFNATFSVVPTYSTLNKGYFTFNGTQTATFLNPLSSQTQLYQNWTVSAWLSIDDTASQVLLNLNSGLFPSYGTNNSLMYLNAGANDYYTYGGDIGALGWKYITFRFRNSDNYRTIFSNAVDISTGGPNNTSTPSGNPGTLTLASNLRGNLARVEIYNRSLTDEEVSQNFNANRGRFGI